MQATNSQRTTVKVGVVLGVLLLIAALIWVKTGSVHITRQQLQGNLPTRLSDADFWALITDLSEPGGTFRSDNFLSNEAGFQEVIPELRSTVSPGGVYMGVGPEQNFTYISALRPGMAFIVDIRRQNMVEHLLYKAFMELSADRADFVSKLFARPRPPGLTTDSSATRLFNAFGQAEPDHGLFEKNLRMANELLMRDGIPSDFLSLDDQKNMRKVYSAFFESGPELSYSFMGSPQKYFRGMPTYAMLMTATDDSGKNWGFLANEAQFQAVQRMEKNNLIVPVVGDFAGEKAVRAVGQYVRSHNSIVNLFYLSNVEQYLFMGNDDWSRFYSNVATLPIDESSMFIRSVNNNGRGGFFTGGKYRSPLESTTSPIQELLADFEADRIHTYFDVVGKYRPTN